MPHGGRASQVDKHKRGHNHYKAAVAVRRSSLKKQPACARVPSKSKGIPVSSLVSKVALLVFLLPLSSLSCYSSFFISLILLSFSTGFHDEGQPRQPEEHDQEGQAFFDKQKGRPSSNLIAKGSSGAFLHSSEAEAEGETSNRGDGNIVTDFGA